MIRSYSEPWLIDRLTKPANLGAWNNVKSNSRGKKRKIGATSCHTFLHFKAKMHQIRFLPGTQPQTPLGELTAP